MTRRSVTATLCLAVLAGPAVLAGCGSDPVGVGEVRVGDAKAGEARSGAEVAVYFEVESNGGDAIVAARSDVAAESTLHELRPADGGGVMLPSDRISLADGTTVLEPMGSHVMLSGLERALVAGERVPVTLEFDRHAPITIEVEIVPLYELAELVQIDG